MGVHGIGRDPDHDRAIGIVDSPQDALVQFCIDRRGVWLAVADGIRGVHVNGRPVLRMTMLRLGDSVHVEGIEMVLAGAGVAEGLPRELVNAPADGNGNLRIVLRGVGGQYHGRCFTLDRPRVVGRLEQSDIRIDDPAFADRHARIELHGEQVVLRDLGSYDGSVVNGERVRDAVLMAGDQVVFDAHHRFVVEAPARATPAATPGHQDRPVATDGADEAPRAGSAWRLPWLLVAAALLATALAALFWFAPK
ncbi:pSer/pThr/pTyr-binding forkhead associated (FHA) protein [Luteimonas cucumeris]|uniref:PSer/pThr/pTyr-binding forkhead associated (FHA) protein n=2 Tax=Luteimonas cucumeris TaxID=985012 RepID=A0A562L8C2_9GAMM|nr:pSer/pThr/pTyr-binding forkhead associated (FHA) protein [Luteimonas cucumeris]